LESVGGPSIGSGAVSVSPAREISVEICRLNFSKRCESAYFSGAVSTLFGGFLPVWADFGNFRGSFSRFLSFFRLRDTSHKQKIPEADVLPIRNTVCEFSMGPILRSKKDDILGQF
jgi:hypothetical protein